jgi:hypothetical protein
VDGVMTITEMPDPVPIMEAQGTLAPICGCSVPEDWDLQAVAEQVRGMSDELMVSDGMPHPEPTGATNMFWAWGMVHEHACSAIRWAVLKGLACRPVPGA